MAADTFRALKRKMRRLDPIMPVRKRKRRIAKKIEKRHGMKRVRGWSYERFSRAAHGLGMELGRILNEQVAKEMARLNPISETNPWSIGVFDPPPPPHVYLTIGRFSLPED